MSDNSAIEWTEATWNPLLGCTKVSAGCQGCYAINEAWKKQHHPNVKIAAAYEGLTAKRADGSLNWTGRINLLPDRLAQPLSWKEPRRIFVNSMSDLFHEQVPDAFIADVFDMMGWSARHHTYQVLTKRPDRMASLVPVLLRDKFGGRTPANIWLGTSVEDQRAADERIPHLLQTPAAVRFLSCEPLLGPIDLGRYLVRCPSCGQPHLGDCEQPTPWPLSWVIAGGESGPGARPMHPDWARHLRDQCHAVGVSFFFKQWGEWAPVCSVHDDDPFDAIEAGGFGGRHLVALEASGAIPHTENDPRGDRCDYQPAPDAWWLARVGKKAAGRLLDGRTWDQFPTPGEQLSLPLEQLSLPLVAPEGRR